MLKGCTVQLFTQQLKSTHHINSHVSESLYRTIFCLKIQFYNKIDWPRAVLPDVGLFLFYGKLRRIS